MKGKKGRGGYIITNSSCEPVHKQVVENLKNEKGDLWPVHTDWEAINASLEYVRDTRGSNKIPANPTIFLFTTYENAFHILSDQKNIRESKKSEVYFNKTKSLMKELHREKIPYSKDDNVKFFWIPEGFINRVPDVVELLNSSKNKYKLS